jgi:hypothetical protein
MKRILSIALLGLLVTPTGCNPFAPDQSVELEVSKLDAPASIAPGSSFAVVLTVVLGGCLSFDRIDVDRSTTHATFTVWGKDASKGRKDIVCPDILIEELHTYQLNPPFANPFQITVNRGPLTPLTATVQIQ